MCGVLRLICSHGNGEIVVYKISYYLVNSFVGGGFVEVVVVVVRFEKRVERIRKLFLILRQSAVTELLRTVSHHKLVFLDLVLRKSEFLQALVYGVGKILQGIGYRAVHIKNNSIFHLLTSYSRGKKRGILLPELLESALVNSVAYFFG